LARTMKQEKITLVFREDLFQEALAECEVSQVTMAELIRRAIDLYLCMFPAPQVYMTDELVPDTPEPAGDNDPAPPTLRKYPFFINTGLLAELDRCAFQVGKSSDELANQGLVLYHAYLLQRREAAEEIEAEEESAAENGGDTTTPVPVAEPEVEPDPELELEYTDQEETTEEETTEPETEEEFDDAGEPDPEQPEQEVDPEHEPAPQPA